MTNPMLNPQQNYSGVTIQILNPAVYAGQCDGRNVPCINSGCIGVNQNRLQNKNEDYVSVPKSISQTERTNNISDSYQESYSSDSRYATKTSGSDLQELSNAYPAQYYMNNYNYGVVNERDRVSEGRNINDINSDNVNRYNREDNIDNKNTRDNKDNKFSSSSDVINKNSTSVSRFYDNYAESSASGNDARYPQRDSGYNSYRNYADGINPNNTDMSKSTNIIEDLNDREAEIQEEKKNTKETKIVALTDEYIKSLENYLNNPNDEIRLMASKEILTRLDEDKDRYDDAALNALLNKMMQDPNKLVRIAALSAFASQLACGNDYTVQLLHNIQSNPNADKEDVLQAADILLKMSAGVEVKNIPNPSVKDKKEQ